METLFSKIIFDELEKMQKDWNCSKELKELDLLKYLNDMLSTLPKEEQVFVQNVIENAKKDIEKNENLLLLSNFNFNIIFYY